MRIIKLLLIILLTTRCSSPEIESYQGDYDLSIMSFNIRFDTTQDGENMWDNRKESCLSMLKDVQPSIFGVQEALYNQVRYFEDNLPEYKYVGVGRDDGHSSGEYAAIFYSSTKFELIDSGNFWLSETPEYPSLGWDANNIRIVTWAKLTDKSNGKEILVFNTHLDHMGHIAQEESGKLIVSKINEMNTNKNTPVFLCGDFNMLIGNPKMSIISENFFCAKRFAEKSDNNRSYNAWGLDIISRNIDFIFYQNSYALSYKTILYGYGVPYISDHYPIIAHFNY